MSPVLIAARNARALRWLAAQSPDMIQIMREAYAKHLSIPANQTNSTFASNEELAWVYGQFGHEIDCLIDGARI